jgi:hypothetical protein
MSFQAKRELLAQIAGRYQDATGTQKSHILEEFVAATGYARKYAIVGAAAGRTSCLESPAAAVRFHPENCGLEQTHRGASGAPVEIAPQRHMKRVYRRTKPRLPRTYRTRPDPLVAVWEEIYAELETAPERT